MQIISGQVPEGFGTEVIGEVLEGPAPDLDEFRKVPVQRLGEAPDISGADT